MLVMHHRTAALSAAIVVLAAPVGASGATWEQANGSEPQATASTAITTGTADLRSPDARDAARQAGGAQDLRSPDTADAAVQATAPAPAATPVVVVADDGGFGLGHAAIIAGGLALLAALGAAALHQRRVDGHLHMPLVRH